MIDRIAVLSGGVGGARFARALDAWRRRNRPEMEITAIVNVGDDFDHLGLRICPDIDSVTYHLAGLGDPVRGWGRADDTAHAFTEIARIMPEHRWFELGDLDIAHNAMRTQLLGERRPLSEVTAELARRYGVGPAVLPVTDRPSPTRVVFGPDARRRALGFQEWWVRDAATPQPAAFEFPLAARAAPAPGVLDALRSAQLVVVAPSNPAVSIAPILAVPGVRQALRTTAAAVVGLSPIIGGRPVRGWADRCLAVIGVECTSAAVAAHYGSRADGGLLDGWLADPEDRRLDFGRCGPVAFCPLRFTAGREDDAIIDALLELADAARARKSGLSV